jgi:hypothetical protein
VNPDVVHQVRDIIAGAERRILVAATARGGQPLRRFLHDIGCAGSAIDPE